MLVERVSGSRGVPSSEGHQASGREGGAVQVYVCNNKRQSLGSGGVTIQGWNSTTS